MLSRLGPRRDGGAGFAEYAGLIVVAALILGALWATGIPAKIEPRVSSALCEIFHGNDCGKPQADGQNGDGGQNDGGKDDGGADDGGKNDGGDQNDDDQGDGPSLAELEKKADDAQGAVDDAGGKYGNIKQQIIDLLKDFIGITDIEECFGEGKISACLWAALDVGSLFFAALKIAKFGKAVKGAIKLWKTYNKGRKAIDKAKDAAKRAKNLVKKKRKECGLPVPAGYRPGRHAPPGTVRAATAGSGVAHVTFVALPAKPRKPSGCESDDPGDGREPPPPNKGDLKNTDPDRLAEEFGEDAAHEIKKETLGRNAKIARFDIKRDPSNGRLYLINKKNPKMQPIDTGYTSKGG